MRFEFFHEGLTESPKLSVDGLVPNGIPLSHWPGNTTPARVKADTSTEIVLNVWRMPNPKELVGDIELVSNNHFDTDGLLSIWTALRGTSAIDLAEPLIAAAEAGDFSAFTTERGIRISLAIQGTDDDGGSPLARHLARGPVRDDAQAYELVLPEVERLLREPDAYEELWRDGWAHVAASLESFAAGRSSVVEDDSGISLVVLADDVYGLRGFHPTRCNPPRYAITAHTRGQVIVIATPTGSGWCYRIDRPYYSWADTVVRPPVEPRDFTSACALLNDREPAREVTWRSDQSEMTSAVKCFDQNRGLGVSRLAPDEVMRAIRASNA